MLEAATGARTACLPKQTEGAPDVLVCNWWSWCMPNTDADRRSTDNADFGSAPPRATATTSSSVGVARC
eukprot:NODE_10926_length_1320_cov_6.297569.p4 GENE.NODE_10926_length_1320_cov_6.297569~~NODE_10926_length_1320_cov_6.297569.p4  ORF type:complete len:69 (+),score=5.70 NODE_10926_length_1320_cov_6.297569:741-947(+)